MTDPKPKLVYLCGPMTGYKDFNYAAFHNAAEVLVAQGFAVLSPASNFEGQQNFPHSTYMRHDFSHVLQADIVMVLTGWPASEGARAEVLIAQQCDIPVIYFESRRPTNITITTVPEFPNAR